MEHGRVNEGFAKALRYGAERAWTLASITKIFNNSRRPHASSDAHRYDAMAGERKAGVAAGSMAMGFLTFVLAFFGYVAFLCFFISRGKTPGKALVGIRVMDKRDGSFPGFGRMLLRETLGKFVSGLFLGVGYFWAIFDRDSQAWHDKIAGTVVLHPHCSLKLRVIEAFCGAHCGPVIRATCA